MKVTAYQYVQDLIAVFGYTEVEAIKVFDNALYNGELDTLLYELGY